jgi:NADH-quinone oxidoreductase subunit C
LLPSQELEVGSQKGQCTVTVPASRLPEVATALRSDPSTLYEMPVCMTCVDWPERDLRFELVYLLRSLVFNDLAWVSVLASEETEVPSLAEVFPGLEWHERECYDLFGVRFVGHPLRKDYVSFGEPVAFTHNIEWALSSQDRPEYMPGATRGAVERP